MGKSGRTHREEPAEELEDPVIWPLGKERTLIVGAISLVLAAIGIAMLWSFGQQIIHVNELAAMRRCWANQYHIDQALARVKKETGVTFEGEEFTVDLMMILVEAGFLAEPVRDTEPDRRGLDGSWKYYRLRKDGRIECAYHGREPEKHRWALDKHLPEGPPPHVETPARKPLPPALLEKYPLEKGDLEHAEYLQAMADQI